MSDSSPVTATVILPGLPGEILPTLDALASALHIPRAVLASDEEIVAAWKDLPRELLRIPESMRNELIARMCVAVGTGLFDSAINYVWNATIQHLRQRMRDFGLHVINRMLGEEFEERNLIELQDSRLLGLCLQLNLITEDGFFLLDQCRATRNNFSAAHPTIGQINDREVILFINRCVKYALSDETSPVGVDLTEFTEAVRGERFVEGQLETWLNRLADTHDAQRQLLFGTLHGIYCDPSVSEQARLNAYDLCAGSRERLTSSTKSDLIERHNGYTARGDEQRLKASRQFFERLGLLELLTESERHSILSGAVKQLWDVHQEFNNFYNEPPFAQRLRDISEQEAIPETVQDAYVSTVVGCYIGNRYGVSWAAEEDYIAMIRSLSPREIRVLVSLPKADSIVGRRIREEPSCSARFGVAIRLIDGTSLGPPRQAEFERLKQKYPG